MGFLRRVFSRVVALIYTGGTVVQVFRLTVAVSWADIPFVVDWVIVLLGPVGLAGLIVFNRQIRYRGVWEHITHWLIVAHLGISIVIHARILVVHSHESLSVFPREYSNFAAVYFAFFAWRSWTLRLSPAPGATVGAGRG